MKKVLLIILVLAAIAGAIGYYMYNKPHDDIASMEPKHTVQATELFAEYTSSETEANAKYLGAVIEVSGTVAAKTGPSEGKPGLVLETDDMMFGVVCEFDSNYISQLNNINIGNQVVVKGKCTGLLMDVVLVRCSLTGPEYD